MTWPTRVTLPKAIAACVKLPLGASLEKSFRAQLSFSKAIILEASDLFSYPSRIFPERNDPINTF
jgi:hypothetical protein